MNMRDRFWAQVGPPDANGCRHWQGARHHGTNYGVFKAATGYQVQAHAFAWRLTYQGPTRFGEVFCHRCDVHYPAGSLLYRPCCEPSHIFHGTQRDNIADAVAKGRMARGDRCRQTKIPEAALPRIHALLAAGIYQADIARAFCVQQACISKIHLGLSRATRQP